MLQLILKTCRDQLKMEFEQNVSVFARTQNKRVNLTPQNLAVFR
jgi:hypothetical protein